MDKNFFDINHELNGKVIKVSISNNLIKKKNNQTKSNIKSNKIFVGGLPLQTNLKEFSLYFSKYGKMIDKVIIIDKNTKKTKGFGFVTFKNIENAVEVINDYKKHEIRGKWIEVKYASPKFLNPKYNNKLQNQNQNKDIKINEVREKNTKKETDIKYKVIIPINENNELKDNIKIEEKIPTISTNPSLICKSKISFTHLKLEKKVLDYQLSIDLNNNINK